MVEVAARKFDIKTTLREARFDQIKSKLKVDFATLLKVDTRRVQLTLQSDSGYSGSSYSSSGYSGSSSHSGSSYYSGHSGSGSSGYSGYSGSMGVEALQLGDQDVLTGLLSAQAGVGIQEGKVADATLSVTILEREAGSAEATLSQVEQTMAGLSTSELAQLIGAEARSQPVLDTNVKTAMKKQESTATSGPPADEGGLSSGAVVLIAAGLLVAIGLIGAAAVVFLKPKRQEHNEGYSRSDMENAARVHQQYRQA